MWDKFTWEKYPQNTETIVSYRVHPTLFNNGSVYSQHGDLVSDKASTCISDMTIKNFKRYSGQNWTFPMYLPLLKIYHNWITMYVNEQEQI